ncbi:MAG TPA: SAM-dependent methyltransferase [Trebonia sp.]
MPAAPSHRPPRPDRPEARPHPVTQDFHFDVPLISRSRADIARLFDGFTLVEPGLVTPAQWRPDLDSPFRDPQTDDDDDEPALKPTVPERSGDDQGSRGTCAGSASRTRYKASMYRPLCTCGEAQAGPRPDDGRHRGHRTPRSLVQSRARRHPAGAAERR